MDNSQLLNQLLMKLDNMLLKQQGFEAEINALKKEVQTLQSLGADTPISQVNAPEPPLPPTAPANIPPRPVHIDPSFPRPIHHPLLQQPNQSQSNLSARPNREKMAESDFEKFIGENLISKIGILILIIGVGIGTKYAIDHEMLSPLTRIILGYATGAGLMGFAIKLKAKYENFSAVLVSGAIAIMYFITYAAYSFFFLIPQPLAFALMVIFTSFTVIAAIKYNKQIIAHIGLVGAYAVPFLLSNGIGEASILYTYMSIINIGILVLSFIKYWKSLFYASFCLTWLIFLTWINPFIWHMYSSQEYNSHAFTVSLVFSTLFFFTFYITNLAYKLRKKEVFGTGDVVILLLNSVTYYGVGYYILSAYRGGSEFLGLFTLTNAIIHFVVSVIIYKKNLANKNLFYLILAMVITFVTVTIPVQLDGGWVTILWSVEAALLFYFGRIKEISIYEKLSSPLILLAFFSLIQDWLNYYEKDLIVTPILNVDFLTACIFIACFIWMLSISQKESKKPAEWLSMRKFLNYAIPSILILVIYFTSILEISKYFNNLLELTKIDMSHRLRSNDHAFKYNYNYVYLEIAWIYIYTLLFASLLTYINTKKIKNGEFAIANLAINILALVIFLIFGLGNLRDLRSFYFSPTEYFKINSFNIGIRYISLACVCLLITQCYKLLCSPLSKNKYKTLFDYLLYISILWILSSELINVLELLHVKGVYKLGLSILWGAYSLFLIGMGLAQNKKHLRIGAMVIFGITLIKLFVYDIYSLSTISKTIIFVSLGALLLIISFLYYKYKHLINDDAKVEN